VEASTPAEACLSVAAFQVRAGGPLVAACQAAVLRMTSPEVADPVGEAAFLVARPWGLLEACPPWVAEPTGVPLLTMSLLVLTSACTLSLMYIARW
jgi:hypothetical protein